MTGRTTLDRQPLVASQALSLIPFLNDLIEEGHVLIRGDRLVIADHVCSDPRFEWTLQKCRSGAKS